MGDQELIWLYYTLVGLSHVVIWAIVCRLIQEKRWPKVRNNTALGGLLVVIFMWPVLYILVPLMNSLDRKIDRDSELRTKYRNDF